MKLALGGAILLLMLLISLPILWADDGDCWTVPLRQVVRVLDGDTLQAQLGIWLNLTATETIRVLGVDTPERHGGTKEAGDAARAFTAAWLARASDLTVTACRRDSFGRLLGMVDGPEGSLGAALLREGHGVAYERGRGR